MPTNDEYIMLAEACLKHDKMGVRRAVQVAAANAEGRGQHHAAGRLRYLLGKVDPWAEVHPHEVERVNLYLNDKTVEQIEPAQGLSGLVLDPMVRRSVDAFLEERRRAAELEAHGIVPTNRILLYGPPGNGKTSLAGAIARELSLPFLVCNYGRLIGSLLGKTLSNLTDMLDQVVDYDCVLFLDEFESIATERSTSDDVADMRRAVAHLLTSIDRLPNRVVLVAATNHESMLDRAVFRRFQLCIELGEPSGSSRVEYLRMYERRVGIKSDALWDFVTDPGRAMSYSDIRELGDLVSRRVILAPEDSDPEAAAAEVIEEWDSRAVPSPEGRER